jgi:hypothetical protein
MQPATHGELSALLKSIVHVAAALVIVWCFYRIACGQVSLF